MTIHEAYIGITVDHLYRDCPALQRSMATRWTAPPKWDHSVGSLCVGTVDPLGTDICGLCAHRWRQKVSA